MIGIAKYIMDSHHGIEYSQTQCFVAKDLLIDKGSLNIEFNDAKKSLTLL